MAGNRVLSLDPLGAPSYFAYDALSRQTEARDALQNASLTTYDQVGAVERSVDARGFATYFEYDQLGRRRGLVNSLGCVLRSCLSDSSSQFGLSSRSRRSPDAGTVMALNRELGRPGMS